MGAKHIIRETPPVVTPPDKALFPDQQVAGTPFMRAMKTLTEKPGWSKIMTTACAAIGTVALIFTMPPVIRSLIGGIVGGAAGHEAADYLKRESHFQTEAAETYYRA